jgi:dolichyl-phosphate beta-glucosyltransferase
MDTFRPSNKLGLVIPCYNEEKRLDLSYWGQVLSENSDVDFLFINDGSSDKTLFKLGVLRRINCQVMSLENNSGKGEAVRIGLDHLSKSEISYSILGFIDCDSAFSNLDIERIKKLASTTLTVNGSWNSVITSRVALSGHKILRKNYRYFIGRLISLFICAGWTNAPYDTQCGFKIFRVDENFRRSIMASFETRWFFDIELLLRLQKGGGSSESWEEPLHFWRDVSGSKINIWSFPRVFKEILQIKRLVLAQGKGNFKWT